MCMCLYDVGIVKRKKNLKLRYMMLDTKMNTTNKMLRMFILDILEFRH